MNKKDMVMALAEQCDTTQVQAGKFLNAFCSTVESELKSGNEVNLPGFGKFVPTHRSSRQVRNPANGEMMMSQAKTTAQFKPSVGLKDL
ncbi:MAG: HU family DNA-binding protein [Hyphomonadaceae bacterium]|nr:HU family DNA-binding protein [Hyphomonadaceae bacterium]MBC6412773.1 HU family DNA-binding protein [Hyphomonadaceae bacterium]